MLITGASTILVQFCAYSTQSRALNSQTLSLSKVVFGRILAETVQSLTVI